MNFHLCAGLDEKFQCCTEFDCILHEIDASVAHRCLCDGNFEPNAINFVLVWHFEGGDDAENHHDLTRIIDEDEVERQIQIAYQMHQQ